MILRTLALLCLLLMPFLGQAQEKPRLDKHGYPLPEGAIARLGNLQFATPESARTVALSPDGKLIATEGKTIYIWDADTGKLVRTIEAPKDYPKKYAAKALAWSQDGQLVASMNGGAEFMIWNVATGKPRWPGPPRTRAGKSTRVTGLRFVDNDRRLAIVTAPAGPSLYHLEFAAGSDRFFEPPGWRVEMWDVAKGELSSVWTVDEEKQARLKALGDGYGFCYVALSRSGEQMAWLASLPPDARPGKSAVFVYETATGKLLHSVQEVPQTYRVDLPDEGKTLVVHPIRPDPVKAITTRKGTVLNISDGKVRFQYDYRFYPPVWVNPWDYTLAGFVFLQRSAVQVGEALLTFDGLGMVRWDLQSGKKLDEFQQFFNLFHTGFAVSAQGNRLVVGEGYRLRVSNGELAPLAKSTAHSPSFVPAVRFLADGRLLAWSGAQGHGRYGRRMQVWDPRQGTVLENILLHPWPVDVSGREQLDFWGKSLVYLDWAEGFAVRDLAANQHVSFLEGIPAKSVTPKGIRAFLSEDGKRVLASIHETDRLDVRWFDAQTGREPGRYTIPFKESFDAGSHGRAVNWYSADGTVFGYLTPDQRLALVDCAKGKVSLVVGIPPQKVQGFLVPLKYTSAGYDRLLFAAPYLDSYANPAYAVWDRQGQLLRRFSLPLKKEKLTRGTRLSHDGRTLAVFSNVEEGIKKIFLYETATGCLRGWITLPYDRFNTWWFGLGVDFSPDGKMLATSGWDEPAILLWDLARPLAGQLALPAPKTIQDAERLWELLGDPDPQKADPALWALVAAPEKTLALLKPRLQPASGPKVAQFAIPPSCLRELRALEVLERIGGKEARQLVAAVADGAEGALLPAEARLILSRWDETTAAK